MKQTTERHSPDRVRTIEEKVIDAMHRYAYSLVREYARPNDRLLEIGFGEGYGSEIVRPWVGEYVGVEVDDEAVAHAADRYPHPSSTFLAYDGETLAFGDSSFDLVISFQVLEHVREPDRFLGEARRVAGGGGVVLVVTPNRNHRLADGERPWNRYHVREFSPSELEAVMRAIVRRGRDLRNPGLGRHERDRARPSGARSQARPPRPTRPALSAPGIDRHEVAGGAQTAVRSGAEQTADEVDVEHMQHGADTASSLDLLAVGRG